MSLDRDAFFIGGEWVAPSSAAVIEVVSPHTEEVVGRPPRPSPPTSTGRRRRPARLRPGPWPRLAPAERLGPDQAPGRALRRAHGRWPS